MKRANRNATTLDVLNPGEQGTVLGLSAQGLWRHRLLDLGLVFGTPIEVLFRAASGQPSAYRFRGVVMALRDVDARAVRVQRRVAPALASPGAGASPIRPKELARWASSKSRAQQPLPPVGNPTDAPSYTVALAGNPNTGKSTIFNALTGLKQHTGNWPGKTVTLCRGRFSSAGRTVHLVDLPGTYSLSAHSPDEEVARDFLFFRRPQVTVTVVDATALERNLGLVLQVLQITGQVVVCLNLCDEAQRRAITVNAERLQDDLGVPVVPTAAASGQGLDALTNAVLQVAETHGEVPPRKMVMDGQTQAAVDQLVAPLLQVAPGLPNAQWVALQILKGDSRMLHAWRSGALAALARDQRFRPGSVAPSRPSVQART